MGDELPPSLHAPTFASEVGKYFMSKIDTIQRQIDADIIDLSASAFTTADGFNRSTPSLSAFKILSANSVKSLTHNSTLSQCPLAWSADVMLFAQSLLRSLTNH